MACGFEQSPADLSKSYRQISEFLDHLKNLVPYGSLADAAVDHGGLSMAQDKKTFFEFSVKAVLLCYFRLLQWTVRFESPLLEPVRQRVQQGLPCVLCTPHSLLLPSVLAMKGFKATFLASRSRDGELIAHVLEHSGFNMARGSSSRGGVPGLAELLRVLRAGGIVGVTHDGPKGPPLVPKPGVALLARHAENGVFLLLPRFKKRLGGLWPGVIRLGSWDRFHLVLPFARIEVLVLAPSSNGNMEDLLKALESMGREVLGELYT
jgi:lysophospholipid acyltransferase (LPLAT)-like uncharacterized protein